MKERKKFCSMLMRIGPTYPGLLDESEGEDRFSTSMYSCLKTATTVGPDQDTATPDGCVHGRTCFKDI